MDFMELFYDLDRGKTANLYLFYGAEELLIREAVNRITSLLVPPSAEELNLTMLEGGNLDAERIVNAIETHPFLSEKRVILIKGINLGSSGKDRLAQPERDMLGRCFCNIPDYSCVVITTRNGVDMRTKLVKAIKDNGIMVEFGKLKPQPFEKWVRKRAEAGGSTMNNAALKYFIRITGYLDRDSGKVLDDVANEIDKLVEYCRNKGEIGIEDVHALAPPKLDTNIFRLVEAIGYKDFREGIRILEDMKLAGEPALRVFFMVARQFRLMLQAAYLKDAGYSSKGIASRINLHPFVVSSLLRQLENFSKNDLKEAILECSSLDIRIKKGRIEPWLALQLLIAGLGGNGNKKSVL